MFFYQQRSKKIYEKIFCTKIYKRSCCTLIYRNTDTQFVQPNGKIKRTSFLNSLFKSSFLQASVHEVDKLLQEFYNFTTTNARKREIECTLEGLQVISCHTHFSLLPINKRIFDLLSQKSSDFWRSCLEIVSNCSLNQIVWFFSASTLEVSLLNTNATKRKSKINFFFFCRIQFKNDGSP